MNVEENFIFIREEKLSSIIQNIYCFVRYNIKLQSPHLLVHLPYVKQGCAPQRINQTWLYILGDVLPLSRLDGQRTATTRECAIRGAVNTLGRLACVRKREKEGVREGWREGRELQRSRLKQSGPLRQQFLRARVQLTTHMIHTQEANAKYLRLAVLRYFFYYSYSYNRTQIHRHFRWHFRPRIVHERPRWN